MPPPSPAPTDSNSVLRRLLVYLQPHRGKLLVGLLCAALAGTVPAGVARMVKRFADQAASGDAQGVLWVALGVVGLYGLLIGLRYGQATLLAEVAQRVGLDLRRDVYAHLQKMSLAYFHRQRTGALMAALTNDVTRLQNSANLIRDGVALPVTAVTMLTMLLWTSPRLVLFTLLVLPLMAGVIQVITRRLRAISTESQHRQADVNAIMDETLSAPRIVKAFVAEDREVARFDAAGEAALQAQMRGVRRAAWLSPAVDFVGAIAMALVLYFGAIQIAQHAREMPQFLIQAQQIGLSGKAAQEWADAHAPGITLGAFLQFVMAANELARSVSGMGSLRGAWQEMLGAADRVFAEVLDVEPDVQDAPDAVELPSVIGRIAFEGVRFAYDPEHTILDGIDLCVDPGEVVALVGETGAGKSTLADLVPRFFDPTQGRVCIDGTDLRSVTQVSLRRQIAIVPQRTVLFAGTIRDNIAYGRPDATEAQIVAAAQAANADGFIREKPEGYATPVGERGTTLSGGQAQRISIARALLADPRILILDEATSALDTATEALVQQALDSLMQGRTTLIIAHRLSTIVNASRIVVLEKGRIREVGSHEQLMAAGGVYAGLYEVQRRAAELGVSVTGAFDDEEMGT